VYRHRAYAPKRSTMNDVENRIHREVEIHTRIRTADVCASSWSVIPRTPSSQAFPIAISDWRNARNGSSTDKPSVREALCRIPSSMLFRPSLFCTSPVNVVSRWDRTPREERHRLGAGPC
jgi:hypothetical protein